MTFAELETIHEYLMSHWSTSDSLDDISMAIDSGFTMLAAKMLKESGAINSNLSNNPELEKSIELAIEQYSDTEYENDISECFGNALVYVNPKTHKHYYVKNDFVDYLIDKDEQWITAE